MKADAITRIRKLNQAYAYTSLQMHEAIGRAAGLSGTDHKYLGFLIQKGPMTAGELARLTGLTTGAITGLIDRFEKKKLVKREWAEGDRRKVMVVPDVDKIRGLLEPLYQAFRHKSEALTASFSEKELRVIEAYLSRGIEIMNETVTALQKNE